MTTENVSNFGVGGAFNDVVGPVLPSATTVAASYEIHHVSGTATIQTLVPPWPAFQGNLTLIADGAWSFGTAGNILYALTATVGQAYTVYYDGLKWAPIVPAAGVGSGTVTNITTTAPVTGGPITTTGAIGVSDFVGSGASHASGTVPDPGAAPGTTRFLREDAAWAVPPGGGGGSTPSGTGFVHVTGGAQDGAAKLVDTADVNAAAITYAKVQNVSAAGKVLGRTTAGAGSIEELSIGGGLIAAAGSLGRAALTGDISASADSNSLTIGPGAVSYSKIQNANQLSVVGRSANSAGVVADITATAATDAVLRESGSTVGWGTIATAGIGANAVTNAKLATMPGNTIKGNNTGGALTPLDLTASQAVAILPAFVASGGSHASGIVPDPGATPGTTKFLREDSTWQVPAGSGSGNVNTSGTPSVGQLGVWVDSTHIKGVGPDSSNATGYVKFTTGTPAYGSIPAGDLPVHTHPGTDINNGSGTQYVTTSALGSGTADSTTFLRGDNTWQTPAGGGTVTVSGAVTTNTLAIWQGATAIESDAGANDVTIQTSGALIPKSPNLTTLGKDNNTSWIVHFFQNYSHYGNSTSNTTLSPTSNDFVRMCDATAATFTLTLPAATGTSATWIFKKKTAANSVIVAAAGGDTIEGSATVTLSAQYSMLWLIDGASGTWYKLGSI